MNKSNPTLVGWSFLILVALIIAAGLSTPAYCQTKDVALLLQQSPARGGVVIPNEGVHHFESQSKVTLNAIPKPGYQFLHWLGDVSDPSSSRTVVCTDKPKIVIAVYEQVEHVHVQRRIRDVDKCSNQEWCRQSEPFPASN